MENFIYLGYINITMMQLEARVRKWGRSFGVVIPKERVIGKGIRENETISILIGKRTSALKETFGTLKLKKTTQEILDESDRQDWDEWDIFLRHLLLMNIPINIPNSLWKFP